jgi:hypothetical protein
MNAELFLLGHRIDMAPRRRRRGLVALVYALFVTGMAGGWFLDRWEFSAFGLLAGASLINHLLLGGKYLGGLVKPFEGKRPALNSETPALLFLRWGFAGFRWSIAGVPEPGDREFKSDEREQRQCDRAHYRAYRAMYVVLVLLWSAAFNLVVHHPFLPVIAAGQITYGLAVLSMFLSLTLPQAILLWTEPDMELEK